VIRGHKHLHDCAYIGDDSSEEADEVAIVEREQAAAMDALHRSNLNRNHSGLHLKGWFYQQFLKYSHLY
jgi:hypothetical protein